MTLMVKAHPSVQLSITKKKIATTTFNFYYKDWYYYIYVHIVLFWYICQCIDDGYNHSIANVGWKKYIHGPSQRIPPTKQSPMNTSSKQWPKKTLVFVATAVVITERLCFKSLDGYFPVPYWYCAIDNRKSFAIIMLIVCIHLSGLSLLRVFKVSKDPERCSSNNNSVEKAHNFYFTSGIYISVAIR